MQLQMDDMLRTIHPHQLLTMSVTKPSVSTAKVAQICDDAPAGYVNKTRAKNGENAFLLRVVSVVKRKCDL